MGRFSDPCSERLAKEYKEKEQRKQIAFASLWKPKPEGKWKIDSLGRYFFDKEHLNKVLEAKQRKV